ncbi:flagellar type III secretion system pore protein FliP [Pilimelia columellifera]|uniref:Flagellar biosynthetic protein FliP n=1 Tax=Pilimelia columellifera subsp. columellifera TaxID=706583 RepID=A0ABP6AFC9_9ACTN
MGQALKALLASIGLALIVLIGSAAPAAAAPAALAAAAAAPAALAAPGDPATIDDGGISIDIGGTGDPAAPGGKVRKPSSSIVILLGLTVLSVAPALLLMCTAFTKIFVVLGITRNALGLTTVPPNQVLAGLALFLSLFIMGPVLSEMNDKGVQPYLKGEVTQAQAFKTGIEPLREFMLKQTREDEIALLTKVADRPRPGKPEDVELTTLIPAFVISELRSAFIIGFVIFIPFLVIDMVVSASLMSLGMMMLPPVTVSLPFKLLLFVMVNGWGLIVTALVSSY